MPERVPRPSFSAVAAAVLPGGARRAARGARRLGRAPVMFASHRGRLLEPAVRSGSTRPRPGRSQPPSFDSTKAAKNPVTVINPAYSCTVSNASGSMVSEIIARIAPAATACVAATTAGEAPPNTT